MVANVSSVANNGNSEILVTNDLLGELSKFVVHNDLQAIPLPHLKLKKHNTYNHHVIMRTSQLQKIDLSYLDNVSAHSFLEEISLDLKLQGPSTYSLSHLQSVCTLDKVKSALKKQYEQAQVSEMDDRRTMFAAGCPGFCMYVFALKNNPKCPRCSTTIPSPSLLAKKPRLDLNAII
ncbi:hypothetical protein K2173_016811 [Erythroxylum novogranatense]|uniref:GIR1-like zinc ribbon domain-containing protein n=1 Tax=Erythroxylum novogranatense TaxID=1862640 RepID=A0AAV8SH30_9ROSI|nr:hypothetical protein K2173_016811 [Erythroxylum novogranatense]